MKRLVGGALVCAALLATAPAAQAAVAVRPVSAILIDAEDGRVLYARDATLVRRPASLTKMMTLFLAFDALDAHTLKLTDRVPVSRHAAAQRPSRLGLKPGTSLSVDEAIRAIAVNSSNDIAVALAEKLGGTESEFAERMTRKARALGMRETAFQNVTGLPGSNTTTAKDMAVLSMALLDQHPLRYAYFGTRSFQWKTRRMQNHNHLLGNFVGLDGIKTGYTVEAGYNLAASARRGGRRLIAVVLGERTVQARDLRVAQMLADGFAGLAIGS
ncbi:D-alanyl-D-alanine carboxypeptidase family protein [Sphingomonas sp. R86521]|uniref:D-alanyl-D-alanine carboxypeptidase family protein n=1 Tax=Sphingomonas sp. R86521 TaxID=3093860 RepID=UPI0036D322B7